jgi:60 kDa SS-A/Ro ribonucleoprotein
MGQTALVRNVTRFARLGLFEDLKFAGDVAKALSDEEKVRSGWMHPVAYANAYFAYTKGVYKTQTSYGYTNKQFVHKTWNVNPTVAAALEDGFYAAFGNVKPSGARVMLSLDVSGSMGAAATSGLAALDCRQASALMALVTLRSEDYVTINGFTSGRVSSTYWGYGRSNGVNDVSGLTELDISAKASIDSAIKTVSGLPFGGTDCSLPMRYALQKKQEIDLFVIYTDNETWAGPQHPHEALTAYNKQMGREARLAVVAMAGGEFTIADPDSSLMLDVAGFDSATPKIISEFAQGNL